MVPTVSAGISAALAGLIAVAAVAGGWIVVGAAAVCVLALAAGWSDVLSLPHRPGTTVLVGALGVVALLVATDQARVMRPLALFSLVMAGAVLSSFAHELVRRDGRVDVVESVTGTLAGQVFAAQAAGWVLLAHAANGRSGVIVAVAGVVAARLVGAMPLPVTTGITAWAGVGCGVAASLVASVFVTGIQPGTAAALGAAVAGVGVGVDRLLVPVQGQRHSAVAVLAWAAAPVAAAGTAAYAMIRIGLI